MKKYALMMVLSILGFTINSCGDEEIVVFNAENGQTYVKFNRTIIDLPIVFDSSADIEIAVDVSTVADTDRTVTVNVVSTGGDAEATPDQFTVASTVTIPAGEYNGMLAFTGIDAGIEIGETRTVTLEIAGIDGDANASTASLEALPTTVNLFQVCPVEEDFFIGDYLLTTTANGIFGTTVFPQEVVTLRQGESSADARVFTAQIYPDLGTFGDIDFNFTLVCGTVVVAAGQETGVGCDAVTTLGPSNSTGGYAADDDSTITIDFADDEGGAGCGTQANVQIVLTRV